MAVDVGDEAEAERPAPDKDEHAVADGGVPPGRGGTVARVCLVGVSAVIATVGVLQLRSDDRPEVVALAAEAIERADTFRMEVSVESTAAGGVTDSPPMKQEMVFSGGTIHGVITAGGLRIESRLVDRVLYLQVAADARERAEIHTPWIAAPAGDRNTAASDGVAMPTPGDQLRELAGTKVAPSYVGDEEIRGVTTSHHRIVLRGKNAQRYAENRGIKGSRSRQAKVELGLWTDGDNLPRRQRTTLSLPLGEDTWTYTTTVELYDFGVEIPPVEEPPADQVTVLASTDELLRQLEHAWGEPMVADTSDLGPGVRDHFCRARAALVTVIADLSPIPSARAEVERAIGDLEAAIAASGGSGPDDEAVQAQLRGLVSDSRNLVGAMRNNMRNSMQRRADRISADLDQLAHNCQ